jgi:Sulfotransferase family
MFYRRAIARMASVVPDARLIALLRDPVERAYSHYLHWHFDKVLEHRTFGEAVADELEAGPVTLAEGRNPSDVDFSYVGRGVYLPQLENITAHYPRESLLVLLLEDMERAPEETFAKVCRFLGIDASVVPDNVGTVANAHHVFRPVWLWRLALERDLWRFVPKRYRMPLVHRMGTHRTPEPIAPEVRERLDDYYASHNAALAEWLGRDLSAWGAPRSRAQA